MQITEHIHAIKIPFRVPISPEKTVERFVYSYLIYGKKVCMIDSGVASSEEAIFNYIRKTGRIPDEISLIVLTHSHPDHIGAAQAIQKVCDCKIAAHVREKSWIENIHLQSKERPIPGFYSLVGGSVNVDNVLTDGDIIDLGNDLRLKVFHTPGHSKGSISLALAADKALFCADTIPLVGSIPIYDDVLESVRSIKKLKAVGEISLLLASWDEPREGARVYQVMDEGLRYLQRIHSAVIRIADKYPSLELTELCVRVLEELGLPRTAANLLVARSFKANLKVRDHKEIL